MASMARISRSRRRRGVSGGSPGSRQLFLEGDDRLRPLSLPLEPAILRLELLDARVDGAGRLAPAAPAHLPQGARLALPPMGLKWLLIIPQETLCRPPSPLG